ncbi:aminopeptidase P family protein [Vibrio sonorensis]|uniref:aminopeptidase P family protein n=1 Tax=Vibrio sonorensis TaxID=1004316 RepID=UPI0008DB2EE1|nr:aminopeptidase P family protein [Vibrio sonorensis]
MTMTVASRIESVREWLANNDIDALLVPHEDEFLGEYVPAHNERLLWLTGFTGSAGAAIVCRDTAAMFVDGRYTVQVTKQVPSELFEYRHLIDEPPVSWITNSLPKGSKIAIDPRMHSANWLESTTSLLSPDFQLVMIDTPIDNLWEDRPVPKPSDVYLMPLEHSGQSSTDKRLAASQVLTNTRTDCALLTSLDSVCWLLNIRGSDIARLPVVLCHAILYSEGNLDLFLDPAVLPSDFHKHVGEGIKVLHPNELISTLSSLNSKRVALDPATSNAWFKLQLQNTGADVVNSNDPTLMLKAAKNATEIKGMKACHIRDGLAMTSFLHWLDKEIELGHLHNEAVLSDKLKSFRQRDPSLRDLSFDTISAAGGNAAMCHYNHENEPTPGQLTMNSLYLVDSGGQYLDGTTDITRTVAVGNPTDEMKHQFTLVLKGHISVAQARFPKGTRGYQIDTLARQFLWAEGFDYDHGTGHGVGHFLNVHEGPQSISKRQIDVPLVEGMVLSNEPGYYRANAFGIRIENLELVVEAKSQGDLSLLSFESLTRCPIDKRAIEVGMLTDNELAWLNDYHEKVYNELKPSLEGEVLDWLQKATSPLNR